VNTLPPETLKAFLDHGRPAETLTVDVEGAREQIQKIAELGIDFEAVTRRLQEEGVEAFAKPFQALLDSIDAKRRRLG
jgi:transaldolase/transaldolase/glucose-6-phosphate isomerase